MYCITQDTGQPYVLYKDSQDGERNPAAIGGSAAQWGSEMYPGIQQQAQQHLQAQQQQNGQNPAAQIASAAQAAAAAVAQQQQQQQQQGQQPQSPTGDPRENGGDGVGRQQGSPSTSPYPPQQRVNGGGPPDDDVTMNQVGNLRCP